MSLNLNHVTNQITDENGSVLFNQDLSNLSSIELGLNLTGDRSSFIDFHSDDTNTDYSARIIRAAGVNSSLSIVQAGTGNIDISGGTNFTRSGNTIWHAGNDGTGSGLDADLIDGLNSTSFLRTDTSNYYFLSNGITSFYNTDGATAATTSGSQASLEVHQNTLNADAFMTFHVSGDYATYFGLDGTTNDLFVGGWSKGANKYRIWHAGNDGTGSGLDADTVDGLHASSFVTDTGKSLATNGYQKLSTGLIIQWGTIATTSGTTVTYPITFPTACTAVVLSGANSGSGHQARATSRTTSNFYVAMDVCCVNVAISWTWIAIGY